MTGIDSLTVGEISIRRAAAPGQRGGLRVVEIIPAQAEALLVPFAMRTVR
jgi:hypothetical protein